MNKRYAIIEDGVVANIIVSEKNPSFMTNMICIEVDTNVQIGYLYDGGNFIENNISNDDYIVSVW